MTLHVFRPEDGKRYEDVYGGWLAFFQKVAEDPLPTVQGIPRSWVALCLYLGAHVQTTEVHFSCDFLVLDWRKQWTESRIQGRQREYVEHMCTLRPELVDALYLSDVRWKTVGRQHTMQKSFVVTNSSSYQRPEVLDYMKLLDGWRPQHDSCVLVPCAADKPYPAPLHKAVRDVVPDHYELIIATGVLGLVPERLWSDMPLYDSGIPNEWRLMKAVEKHFDKCSYSRIVVYGDYYNEAIRRGLRNAGLLNGVNYSIVNDDTDTYLDLLDTDRLRLLAEACE